MTDIREIILTVPVFLLAISLHEYAHALVAVRLGDPTPRYQGRLTLNFTSHVSLLGTLMLLVAGIGWAKPVQINTRNLKDPVRDMIWISLAGPVANVVLAVIFAIIARIVRPFLPMTIIGQSIFAILYIGVYLNLLLAVFNLIPIPPLDGSKMAGAVLPYRVTQSLAGIERWGFLIIYVLPRYWLGSILEVWLPELEHICFYEEGLGMKNQLSRWSVSSWCKGMLVLLLRSAQVVSGSSHTNVQGVHATFFVAG